MRQQTFGGSLSERTLGRYQEAEGRGEESKLRALVAKSHYLQHLHRKDVRGEAGGLAPQPAVGAGSARAGAGDLYVLRPGQAWACMCCGRGKLTTQAWPWRVVLAQAGSLPLPYHLLLPNASLASKGMIPISCLAVGRQGTEFPGTLAGGWGGALREGASFQK